MKIMKKGLVYQAKNLITGKIYIGCTIRDLKIRIREHWSKSIIASKAVTKSGKPKRLPKFQKALVNSKREDWEWTVLKTDIPRPDLKAWEIFYMVLLDSKNNGLNSTWGIGRH